MKRYKKVPRNGTRRENHEDQKQVLRTHSGNQMELSPETRLSP